MVHVGDALEVLRTLEPESVQCCVTSPPYWGLRDYGVPGQLGLERTPAEYVARMVEVFEEVRRVLRADGTCWVNLGDSYAGSGKGPSNGESKQCSNIGSLINPTRNTAQFENGQAPTEWLPVPRGLKPKDLVGIPWRMAFALQDAGWYLRSDIIWAKPNPMPESVTDRPTKSHEYLFLLSKNARYFYDADAIAEPLARPDEADRATPARFGGALKHVEAQKQSRLHSGNEYTGTDDGTRNARTVWTIATSPFPEAHFATFPPEIPRRCILAGSRHGDTVLDPFAGAGTTGLVASRLGREFVGIELNPTYAEMARRRIYDDAPLLNGGAA